jgi:hypothetical protein
MTPRTALLVTLFTLLPASAFAQRAPCVPGNPLYDRGDYRCFGERPIPTRARTAVTARVEAARYLSGAALSPHLRATLEDHFSDLSSSLAEDLPSLVDGDGDLHTPDVRLAVVLLPSGSVGRVRVLTRHGDPLDRRIAQSLAAGVSESEGVSIDGSELEVIVRLRPRLHYTRWRAPRHPTCCIDDVEE